MKKTLILLIFLFLASPLVILIRVILEKIDRSIQRFFDWIKQFLPAWLTGSGDEGR